MGQHFIGAQAPWTQVLEQIDFREGTADECVGALEAAAEVANSRALVIIDALNEGLGRNIWPSHLAAFLVRLERSPWIGTVLSVRSSYEELIVPREIRDHAISLVHYGFAGHEYDATRAFFIHYGLELPSTPLLSPEFRNPLFLKTVCLGLNASNERRLPRGFLGITATFDLYLAAIEERLAASLDYNPKSRLVSGALGKFSRALVISGNRWLALRNAMDVVNALLPGRDDFSRSLYRGMVTETVLVEDLSFANDTPEDVVHISYERLADHLMAKSLLDDHFNPDDPKSAFAEDGPLAFLFDRRQHVFPGLVEALCIQIPERAPHELPSLAPGIKNLWYFGNAYRQSIVWRAPTAFNHETFEILDGLIHADEDFAETLDVLITVASIPGHPFNAQFLNTRLRKYSMPERDAWWSTYLHHAWDTRSAVDRLVDWAATVDSNTALDDEAVFLCATTLSWMLTTSNRFLRDRTTTALVNLLTGRINLALPLIDEMQDVDDLYVLERLYAVAFGLAMRSNDAEEVGALAEKVYGYIFAKGEPPAHVLLRDYARGAIERALYLGADFAIVEELIRPPYSSHWPAIPSEEDVEKITKDPSGETPGVGDRDWGRSRIVNSVLLDDFSIYVIGSDFKHEGWLSAGLKEACWLSPDERLKVLVSEFSIEERTAWESFEELQLRAMRLEWSRTFASRADGDESGDVRNSPADALQEEEVAADQVEHELQEAATTVDSILSEQHLTQLAEILEAKNRHGTDETPHFDHKLIQRYILWRVFNLGWTAERFGHFDECSIGYSGRDASKAERIGKKYQWIAYHEILAMVADHFQFCEGYGNERCHEYMGPWQLGRRDIDPSCTLRSNPGGTGWGSHSLSWWAPIEYDAWGSTDDPESWVINEEGLPCLKSLLCTVRQEDGTSWVNIDGFLVWSRPIPPDKESSEYERRELWYIFDAYLIRKSDMASFMEWAAKVSFKGKWMPEPPTLYGMFFGEHGWSPASGCLDKGEWHEVEKGCPSEVRLTSLEYVREVSTFDCSVDDSYSLRLPDKHLMTGLGLKWTGEAADFVNEAGEVVAMDPTAHEAGPSALLIREDALRAYLDREELAIVWAVLGEKRAFGPGSRPRFFGELSISGAFTLVDDGLDGFLKCVGKLAKKGEDE